MGSLLLLLNSVPCSDNASQEGAGAVAYAAAATAVATLVEVAGASEGERSSETDLADRRVRHVRRGGVSVYCWENRGEEER